MICVLFTQGLFGTAPSEAAPAQRYSSSALCDTVLHCSTELKLAPRCYSQQSGGEASGARKTWLLWLRATMALQDTTVDEAGAE